MANILQMTFSNAFAWESKYQMSLWASMYQISQLSTYQKCLSGVIELADSLHNFQPFFPNSFLL